MSGRAGVAGRRTEVPPLTITDLVRYAGASGDFNPIHHDPEAAARFGSPSVFAHGMLSAGLLASFLEAEVGVDGITAFQMRFRDRVWPGETLAAMITAASDEAVELALTRASDEVVVDARAEYGDPDADAALPEDYRASGEPYRWPVEEGAARELAAALRRAGEPPGPGSAAPLTMIVTALRWGSEPNVVERIGFDLGRMLNSSNRLEFFGPLPAVGEELTIREGIGGCHEKESKRGGVMRFAEAIASAEDRSGLVRARARLQMVELPPG
ncbi:MAG: MaoC/PaaZ C-terminal domain-containing protein [Acidimicrobiia bacterium]|nr:MaoC/PaaZ C-terminal domain-containing protein [Acidimicrobiia bacterium]